MQKKIIILLGLIYLTYSMNLSSLLQTPEDATTCPTGQYFKPGCDDCKIYCKTCPNSKDCSVCKASTTRDAPDCICKDKFYETSTNDPVTDQDKIIDCGSCSKKCAKCEKSADGCTECESPRIESPVCRCPDGQQDDLDNMPACKDCPIQCSKCQTVPCTCSANRVGDKCECPAGTYNQINFACISDKAEKAKCPTCPDECTECDVIEKASCDSKEYKCQKCKDENRMPKDSFVALGSDDYSCICKPGYVEVNGVCQLCHKCCGENDNGIKECNTQKCNTCPEDRILSPTKWGTFFASYQLCSCKFADGYCENYNKDSCSVCTKCFYKCGTCSLKDSQTLEGTSVDCAIQCDTCSSSTRNIEKNCNCLEGYFEDESQKSTHCTKCEKPCLTCKSAKECITCDGNNRTPDTCICDDHYYQPEEYPCDECNFQCTTCPQKRNCDECSGDFSKDNCNEERTTKRMKVPFVSLNCCCPDKQIENPEKKICEDCTYFCKDCGWGQKEIQGTAYDFKWCNCKDNYVQEIDPVTYNEKCNCPYNTGYYESSQECHKCHEYCEKCSTTKNNCDLCKEGSNRGPVPICDCQRGSKVGDTIVQGYFEKNSEVNCYPCNDPIKLCIDCEFKIIENSNELICNLCNKDYCPLESDHGKTCACCPGVVCEECPTPCTKCIWKVTNSELDKCTECSETYVVIDDQCKCPVGKTKSPTSTVVPPPCIDCETATGIAHCSKCDGKTCLECEGELKLNKVSSDPSNENLECSCEHLREVADKCELSYKFAPDPADHTKCKGCILFPIEYTWFSCREDRTKECQDNRELIDSNCVCKSTFFENDKCCQKCLEPCHTCTGNKNCDTCTEGKERILVDGFCKCKDGFYGMEPLDYSTKDYAIQIEDWVCKPCKHVCGKCIKPVDEEIYHCETCNDPESKNRLDTPPYCQCKDKYQENWILSRDDPKYPECIPCPVQCKTCKDGQCTSCPDTRDLIDNDCKCQEGKYETGLEKCLNCPCKCKKCTANKKADGNYDDPFCTECTNDRLYAPRCDCPEGKFDPFTGKDWDITKPDYRDNCVGTCENCIKFCKICSAANQCDECFTDTREFSQSKCVCKEGFYPIKSPSQQSECATCGQCGYKCKTCNNDKECTSCYPNRDMANHCECNSGLIENENKECIENPEDNNEIRFIQINGLYIPIEQLI